MPLVDRQDRTLPPARTPHEQVADSGSVERRTEEEQVLDHGLPRAGARVDERQTAPVLHEIVAQRNGDEGCSSIRGGGADR